MYTSHTLKFGLLFGGAENCLKEETYKQRVLFAQYEYVSHTTQNTEW